MYRTPPPATAGPYHRQRACVDPCLDAKLLDAGRRSVARVQRIKTTMDLSDRDLGLALATISGRLCSDRNVSEAVEKSLDVAVRILSGDAVAGPEARTSIAEVLDRALLRGDVGPDSHGAEIVTEVVWRLEGGEEALLINDEA